MGVRKLRNIGNTSVSKRISSYEDWKKRYKDALNLKNKPCRAK